MNGGEQDDLDCLLTDYIAVIGVICCLSRALIPGQLPAGVSHPSLLVALFHEKHVIDYARISTAALVANEYMNNEVLDKRLDAGSPRASMAGRTEDDDRSGSDNRNRSDNSRFEMNGKALSVRP